MPKSAPELPVETELVDDAWYSTDGIAVAKYDKQTDTLAVPGVGVTKLPKYLMRMAPVAEWTAPVAEPQCFAAAVEDPAGVRFVRVALGNADRPWFNFEQGFKDWDDLIRPLALLTVGVPDKEPRR